MSARTEPSAPASAAAAASSISAPRRKPRLALFIATAGGLGYLPKAPGTWGSLAGIALATVPYWFLVAASLAGTDLVLSVSARFVDPFLIAQCAVAVFIAVIGTWSAARAAEFWQVKDPGRVVVDEVSGQHLTLLLGCAMPIWSRGSGIALQNPGLGLITLHTALNWKYLVLGFILFRVF